MPPLAQFLNEAGYTTGENADIRIFLAGLIQIALALTGFIFFLVILYAGYLWFTAGSNTEVIGRAKKILAGAVVGFIITLSAYIITRTVAEALVQALRV